MGTTGNLQVVAWTEGTRGTFGILEESRDCNHAQGRHGDPRDCLESDQGRRGLQRCSREERGRRSSLASELSAVGTSVVLLSLKLPLLKRFKTRRLGSLRDVELLRWRAWDCRIPERLSICTLLLQVELLPDRDPDNDGTKISVSITGTRDRGRML